MFFLAQTATETFQVRNVCQEYNMMIDEHLLFVFKSWLGCVDATFALKVTIISTSEVVVYMLLCLILQQHLTA